MKSHIACTVLLAALMGCNQAEKTLNLEDVAGPTPGKWKLAMVSNGEASTPRNTCIKEQTTLAAAAQQPTQPGYTCSPPIARKDGDDLVMESACSKEDTTSITSNVRVAGDLKSAYTMVITTTVRPPPPPPPATPSEPEVHQIKIVGERLGDC
jgi:hypothetical protein